MTERIFISHGAPRFDRTVNWFIVEPRDDPDLAVISLLRADRTVIELDVEPYQQRVVSVDTTDRGQAPRYRS